MCTGEAFTTAWAQVSGGLVDGALQQLQNLFSSEVHPDSLDERYNAHQGHLVAREHFPELRIELLHGCESQRDDGSDRESRGHLGSAVTSPEDLPEKFADELLKGFVRNDCLDDG
ncbi:MAG: hypothetical protein ACYTDW_20520 [Planctomycetota bacterium]